MYAVVLYVCAVISCVTSGPFHAAVEEEPLSNLDLLIPLVMENKNAVGKKSLYLDDMFRNQTDANERDTEFSAIPANTFVLDGLKRSEASPRDGSKNEKNIFKKDLSQTYFKDLLPKSNLISNELNLDKKAYIKPKINLKQQQLELKFLLMKNCLQKLDDKFGNNIKTATSAEMSLYLCKELIDTFVATKDVQEVNGSKSQVDASIASEIKDNTPAMAVEIESKDKKFNDCTKCCHVLVYEEKINNFDDEFNEIQTQKRIDFLRNVHFGLPGPLRELPLNGFDVVNGRRH